MEKDINNKKRMTFIVIAILVVVIGAMAGGIYFGYNSAKIDSPTVVTEVSVMDFIEKDQLNTFRMNYEGVVTVYDPKKEEDIDYHVYYEAVVDAGINFSEIQIEQDNEKKEITVFVPNAAIQDIVIDITTLDFLFYDEKADDEDVLNEAYKICNKDAESKVKGKEKILVLANENVRNLINAYLQPFMDLTNDEYTVNYIIGDQNEGN